MDPKKGGVLGASWATLGPSLSGSGGPGHWFGRGLGGVSLRRSEGFGWLKRVEGRKLGGYKVTMLQRYKVRRYMWVSR